MKNTDFFLYIEYGKNFYNRMENQIVPVNRLREVSIMVTVT